MSVITKLENRLWSLEDKKSKTIDSIRKLEFQIKIETLNELGYKPNKSMTVYKKVKLHKIGAIGNNYHYGILTLKVPKEASKVKPIFGDRKFILANRYLKYHDKIRVSEAKVIGVEKLTYKRGKTVLEKLTAKDLQLYKITPYMYWRSNFYYKLGEVSKPRHKFNKSIFEDCASGIHCFEDKQKAINYV